MEHNYQWSRSTTRHYTSTLHKVGTWLTNLGIADASQVTPDLLHHWLNEHPHWSASSRYGAIAAMRGFFKWAGFDTAHKLALPKRPKESRRRALRPEEALQLLSFPDTSTLKGIRDLAIVALLLETGIRNRELCGLRLEDLYLKDCACQVFVKGGRWEWAVFCEYTGQILAEWIVAREGVANTGVREVFVAITHKNKGLPLNPQSLYNIIIKLARNAELGHLSPHELRHSFAEIATRAGAPAHLLKAGGRWLDMREVVRYTGRIELDAFRRYSPMNYVLGLDDA